MSSVAADASGNAATARKVSVFYPDVMPGPLPPAMMFAPQPATRWPFVDLEDLPVFKEWNERIGGQFK